MILALRREDSDRHLHLSFGAAASSNWLFRLFLHPRDGFQTLQASVPRPVDVAATGSYHLTSLPPV